MSETLNLPLILAAAFAATASPGPATLAIAGASMSSGRRLGLAVAAGVTTGSWAWSVAAALGLGTLMLASRWAFEAVRYIGAAYLMFLALRSAKSVLARDTPAPAAVPVGSVERAYVSGLALHLMNPKAVLFFGSLFALGVPSGTSASGLMTVIATVGLQSALVFHGYALLFSSEPMVRRYMRLRRWFDGAFAVAFGAASLKVLTARLQ